MQNDGATTTPDANKAPEAGSIYNLDGFVKSLDSIGKSTLNVLGPMAQLEASGEQLAETFGYAGSRVIEMEKQINKSATSILGLSKNAMTYEASMKRAGDIVKEVSIVTNRNVVASSDVIKSLELTAEATGVSTKDLAQNFTNAGFQLTDVSTQMETAAKVAQKLGVNVGAVTKGLSDNLKNLNIYNFQGGVVGLAKMVAKSAVLGVNMQSVFDVAEKAFDPEQAIELASRMQSLGVATSDLLDPLKIMDLGQNNPDELMKQMVNVTKGLTKIDEVSGKVSILPGEQGRMRELALAMGMSKEELSQMAIKSGELEFKMKKIAFPKMDVPMTEEDREMIANLSQFSQIGDKKGFAVTVESGEQKFVNELNPDDVAFLKQQAIPKTLEDIAQDQLTVSQKMLKTMEFIASAPRGGLARGEKGQEFRRKMDKEVANPVIKGAFKKDEKGEDFHDQMATSMNGIADTLLTDLPGKLFKLVEGAIEPGKEFNLTKFQTDLGGVMAGIGTDLKGKLTEVTIPFTNLATNIGKEVVKAQGQKLPGVVESAAATATSTTPAPSLNWHETLDASMEEYKKSMESQSITTPTEKTSQQIEEDKNKKDMEAMEEMITAALQPNETPGLNMSPVIDNGIVQTDRLIQRVDLLIDAVKESKFVIDYDKLKIQEKGDENYASIFEPIVNKLNDLVSIQEKIIGIKSPEQTIVENKEVIIENNKIETEGKQNEPLFLNENKADNKQVADNISTMSENFLAKLEKFKEETKNTIDFDYEKFNDKFGSKEKGKENLFDLENRLKDLSSKIEQKNIASKDIMPIPTNNESPDKKIETENKIVQTNVETPETKFFDFNPLAQSINLMSDKLSNNQLSIRDFKPNNKLEFNYQEFASKLPNDKNYSDILNPLSNKISSLASSTESQISGIKNLEPNTIEKKEFKETLIKENSPVAEIPRAEKIILAESNEKDKNVESLPKITESKLPESAVRTNAEMSPVTMRTESTTNVGGEITLVVEVRGLQNDSSRIVADEITKKLNSGEFADAFISQIKNKQSAYGQLSGNQSVIPPGFG